MAFDLGTAPATRPPTQAEKQQIKAVLALSASDITDINTVTRSLSVAIMQTVNSDFQALYSITQTTSSDWSDTYTTVHANSANWSLSSNPDIDTIVTSNSANWSDTYTTVHANSANWGVPPLALPPLFVSDAAARKSYQTYSDENIIPVIGLKVVQNDVPDVIWEILDDVDITNDSSWQGVPRTDETGALPLGGVVFTTTNQEISGIKTFTPSIVLSAINFNNLPSGSDLYIGARAFIVDGDSSIFNSIVTGGGNIKIPVFYDGSDWRVG